MSTVSERILKIRKRNSLSRVAFGEKIGVSQDVINNIERNRNKKGVPNNIVKLISAKFNVNENWIITGEGDMLASEIPFNEYAEQRGMTDFEKDLILKYLDLSPATRKEIMDILKSVFSEKSD